MRNFLYRLSSAMARFMYGRNGFDGLNMALMLAYLLVLLVQIILGRSQTARLILNLVTLLLAFLILFRAFSKNLSKRRSENAQYLALQNAVKNRISFFRQRRKDKEHKYFVCKNCKTICRVPVGKGKVEITCPKCGQKIMGKS